MLAGTKPNPPRGALALRRCAPVLLPLCLGIAGSVAAFSQIRQAERRALETEFIRLADDRSTAIIRALSTDVLVLRGIKQFFSGSDEVTREEFRTFVAPFIETKRGIQALEWIPRVPKRDRARFEAEARTDGDDGFRFTERGDQGEMRPAAEREEYFPVYYVEPYEGNEAAFGFDLGSNAARLAALRMSRDTGAMVATQRIRLVQEGCSQYGVLLFLPLYDSLQEPKTVARRRSAHRGFVLGVFRVDDMIRTALGDLQPCGIDIRLNDLSAPPEERLLGRHPLDLPDTSKRPMDSASRDATGLCRTTEFPVGRRTWQILCSPTRGFVAAQLTWMPWWAFGAGLAFTLLLCVYLLSVLNRASRVEQLVEERTNKLAEIERTTRGMLETPLTSMFLCDADGRILAANALGASRLGMRVEDMIGEDLFALMPVEVGSRRRAKLRQVIETGKPLRFEDERAGIRFDSCFYPVQDADGNVSRVAIHAHDITDRVKTEDAIRENEQKFRLIFENARDAIFWADPETGLITHCNRAAEQLLERDRDEIIGSPQTILHPPEKAESYRKVFAQHVRQEGGLDEEAEVVTSAGEIRPVRITASITEVGDRGIVQGIFHDISDVKRAEEELWQAKEQAEAASRIKAEFVANMSHEIRTPLTAILGFADILQGEELPREQHQEYLEIIRRNGEHLLTIINDILDLSKIEADKLTIEQVAFSVPQLISEVASLMRVRAKGKNLDLDVAYGPGVPERLVSDPVRLRQILVNLVGNAIKFTEVGGVRLIVSMIPPGEGDATVQFEVADTGIGMTSEQIDRLFKPFSQADSSTTRHFGGTGLGLTISKRLAKMLGGDIVVESEPGRGSRFSVTIDAGFVEEDTMMAEAHEAVVARKDLSTSDAHGELSGRVLLAEDGPDNQRLVGFLLRKAGLEVDVAENGRVALERVEQAPAGYDLILMDMQMPEMDGYEAARRLREQGYRGTIIALTAHAMEGDREKCLAAGCDDYASKPIERRKLVEKIATYLHCPATESP